MSSRSNSTCTCWMSLAVLLVVLLILGLLLLRPWWSQNASYDQTMEDRAGQLTRFRDLAAQRPRLEEELERLRKAADQTQYYVPASTPAVAAAELQKLVKRIIDANQGKLVSTQSLPMRDDGSVVRIAIRVRISVKQETLAPILHAMEGGRPLLLVDNLSIRSRKIRRRRNQPASAKLQNLDVRFELIGYMQRVTG